MRTLFAVLILASVAVARGSAANVAARDGNIVYTAADGSVKKLTASGRDRAPVLAPDGKWVVFVRAIDGAKISTGSDEFAPSELWQVRTDGREPLMLVRARAGSGEHVVAGFENVRFSCDGKLVYFMTPAWATSAAIHVVDTTTRKSRFVCPGNDVQVVCAGEHRGSLLVQQHRYFVGGGSYDWYWLVRNDGREIGPVGEDTTNFLDTAGR